MSATPEIRRVYQDLEKEGIRLDGEMGPRFEEILTPEALRFVAGLCRNFAPTRAALLKKRDERQAEIDAGRMPDFLPSTEEIRSSAWTISPVPPDLHDRRVEITGPVDRKMIINALNSGAKVYMADFEDSHSPVWEATVQGQINLKDAVRRAIEYVSPEGKRYVLSEKTATLMVRPRGWHLEERHLRVDGQKAPAALFDFGLFIFHNAKALLGRGTGPYFYLPKLESLLEARLWNEVFVFAEKELGLARGSIKATVLIETILAAFEMDEILYELREHSAGLNCGRWDYIFSFIKKFRAHARFTLPDRSQVAMTTHFLRSYSRLLIQTCHRRGAHAMGGMAAQIPIKNDAAANALAMSKVSQDKEREVGDGHDGTWVAHPGLVPLAGEIFNRHMPAPNQIGRELENLSIGAQDLLTVPEGAITEKGLRINLDVGVQYLAAWLSGNGCVPLYHLMEDAATSEISRAQVWQWLRHGAKLDDGKPLTLQRVKTILKETQDGILSAVGPQKYEAGRYALAAKLFQDMLESSEFVPFLTLPAYEHLD
ncbi:MAG: malate synthase A [Elusimicrobia bacterium]|nr:malate synthase A [Elusimicrobiota bacterium]